jgi:cysteine desulfurase/selenocysteine lyase
LPFVLDGHRTEDIGSALNQEGIAVRTGAQPILRRFGVESTVRPSFALYNTTSDVDALIAALAPITGGLNPPITPHPAGNFPQPRGV